MVDDPTLHDVLNRRTNETGVGPDHRRVGSDKLIVSGAPGARFVHGFSQHGAGAGYERERIVVAQHDKSVAHRL
jgi:hypothetical protein